LGFKIHEENKEAHWLEVKCGDGLLGIWKASTSSHDKPGQSAVLTFRVDDVERVKKFFENKGVHFKGDIVEMLGVFKIATFIDTDGNTYQLYQQL
jgi:predicted enzyme related to lactoylglutathione lyase